MSEKEIFVLGDPSVFPSEAIISGILDQKTELWQKVIEYVTVNYKDVISGWKYYNDGKQWLFRMQIKKKTIFWSAMLADTFRITFYFGDKAEPVIEGSTLPENVKSDFRSARRFGSTRPITIKVSGSGDLETICKLIDLKAKIK
ncbi:MAG: DUF3788 family protein [Bacteroidales bacterium]|jgi:hypothetical protein|nr:DUF3788 family protein [Bacteroidales bacterium]